MQLSSVGNRGMVSDGASPTVAQLLRVLIVISVVLVGFPRHLSPEVGVLPVPVTTIGIIILNVAVFGCVLISSSLRSPGVVLVLLGLATLYLVGRGLFNHSHIEFSLYFFFREVLFLGSLLAGGVLGAFVARREALQLTVLVFVVSSGCLLFHSVGLIFRYGLSGRTLDPPLFAYTSAIAILMPCLATKWSESLRMRSILVGGIFSYCFFAAISGTRSTLVFLAVAGVASLAVLVRSRILGIGAVLRFVAGVMCIIAVGFYLGMFDLVLDRLSETMIEDEVRIIEAKEVLAIAHEWWPWGYGIGVGLETSVGYEEGPDSRVNAPHIGILAWAIKAGWLGLVVVAAFLTTAFRSCLADSLTRLGFGLGILVYIAISLISGGWVPWELFLLGFCLTGSRHTPYLARLRRTRQAQPPSSLIKCHAEAPHHLSR